MQRLEVPEVALRPKPRRPGEPCSMLDLVKKVRATEVRGDLISADRVKAPKGS